MSGWQHSKVPLMILYSEMHGKCGESISAAQRLCSFHLSTGVKPPHLLIYFTPTNSSTALHAPLERHILRVLCTPHSNFFVQITKPDYDTFH